MLNPSHPLIKLIREDRRYRLEAYLFVFEALTYAQKELQMGEEESTESVEEEEQLSSQRHLTGQQLCEAIRLFALDQFGYMAKCVLNSWGVHRTGDFGEIVYNLIKIRQMRKTADDRREDFDDVYDFESAFCQSFEFQVSNG